MTQEAVDNVQETPSANDYQPGGNHYRNKGGEQLWDRIIRVFGWPRAKVFLIGNVMKYLERHEEKDGLKDLRKAKHYLEKLIEEEAKRANGATTMPKEQVSTNPEGVHYVSSVSDTRTRCGLHTFTSGGRSNTEWSHVTCSDCLNKKLLDE